MGKEEIEIEGEGERREREKGEVAELENRISITGHKQETIVYPISVCPPLPSPPPVLQYGSFN